MSETISEIMVFDAIAARESLKKERESIATRYFDITSVYPVAGITEEGFIKLRTPVNTIIYCNPMRPQKYDLNNITAEDADSVLIEHWKFQREFGDSVKEIYLNFPETNTDQQNYIKRMMERTNDPHQLDRLESELDKLQWIEKTIKKRQSFVFFFGNTVMELKSELAGLSKYPRLNFRELTMKQKESLYRLMNNTGGIIHEAE